MRNIITACMTIIFLFIITFIILNIYKWKVDSYHTKEQITEIKKIIDNPIKKKFIDLDNLSKKNKDTLGYIIVNNTNINYPCVKTNNNDYYLDHSFNKKKNDAGWIFMDYRNNINDKNIILYGHDRKDNTMFGTLKYTLKKDWQKDKANHIITLFISNEKRLYQVFSTYTIKTENYYITTDFKKNNFSKFIKTIKNRSNYNYDVEVNENDNILTLSSCYTEKEKVVLHAKLLK